MKYTIETDNRFSLNRHQLCNLGQKRSSQLFGIQRFVDAQTSYGSFNDALKEIENGRKESHWIWFVFPQLYGLGTSRMCEIYGLRGIGEARTYLRNRFLRENLRMIVRALLKHSGVSAVQILGTVDAVKVRSCATLFYRAALTKIDRELFKRVLDTFYGGKEDPLTVKMIESEVKQ